MKEKQVNYKRASIYYLVGNLFNKGMSFLTVPIFTRILSTSDYGIVTTYNSWIAILSMVVGLALHMGIRAAFVDYEENINDFISVATTFSITWGLVLCAIVLAASTLIKININVTLLVLCFLQGLASALVEDYSMYLMMQYRYKFRTALMILPNLISMILSIIAIIFVVSTEHLYMGRIVPTACVYILFGILVCLWVYKKSQIFHRKEYLKYGLSISAPLVLHGIALNILSQSDRTMITCLADASQTGIYSLIYNFSMIATVLTTSLEGVWVPWFMKKYQDGKMKEINALAIDYVHLMTYAMVSLILVGPEIVHFLASEKYWEGIIIIPPVVLANYLVFLYTLYVNVEHVHKKTVYITVNTIIAAVLNVILNFLLIPHYGYAAAAYTTLVSYCIALLLHAAYSKKLNKEIYPLKIFLSSNMHIVVATCLFYFFIELGWFRWSIAVIYVGIMAFHNREKIFGIFPSLQNKLNRRIK